MKNTISPTNKETLAKFLFLFFPLELCPALIEDSHRKIESMPCLSAPYEGYTCTYACEDGYLLNGAQERQVKFSEFAM